MTRVENDVPKIHLALVVLVLFVSAYAFIQARGFPSIAGYFPLFASSMAIVIASFEVLAAVVRQRRRRRSVDTRARASRGSTGTESEGAPSEPSSAESLVYIAWAILFGVLFIVIGVLPAIAVWMSLYLRLNTYLKWWMIAVWTGGTLLVVHIFVLTGILRVPSVKFPL